MFHEVAHGLSIKNTIDGRDTVQEALKEHASALEEGTADVLGLYMVTQLHKFERNTESGIYQVNYDQIQQAMNNLSKDTLTLQGDGDYESVAG